MYRSTITISTAALILLLTFASDFGGRGTSASTAAAGFDLLGRILRATREAIDVKQEKLRGSQFSDWTPEEQEETKELLRLADWIGAQVYFASGAFRESGAGSDEEKLGEKERRRFYTEAGAILDDLIDLGLPKVAHNLVKLFETVIDFDPRGVLLCIARTVRASKTSGFQYDPMAAGLVVTLVERFLAKYRYILQGCEECRKAVVEFSTFLLSRGGRVRDDFHIAWIFIVSNRIAKLER